MSRFELQRCRAYGAGAERGAVPARSGSSAKRPPKLSNLISVWTCCEPGRFALPFRCAALAGQGKSPGAICNSWKCWAAKLQFNCRLLDNIMPNLKSSREKPIYDGFPIIEESLTDGWRYGAITRYENKAGCESGDGFVIAPDGSRAGLDWTVGHGEIRQVARPDARQWGVYEVFFPTPVRNKDDLVACFRAVLPQVQRIYETIRGTP